MALPNELRPGDEFVYRGILYRVIRDPVAGKYATWTVPVRRIRPDETVAFDYNQEIDVIRPRGSRPSSGVSVEKGDE